MSVRIRNTIARGRGDSAQSSWPSLREILSNTPVSVLERLRSVPKPADWSRLVDLYTPFVEYWLQLANIPKSDLDDLAQDVMTALVREVPKFEHSGRTGAFRKWLRSLVVHRTLAYWRKRRTRGSAVNQAQAVTILESLEDRRAELGERFTAEHDTFVLRRLMELIEHDFTVSTWRAFHEQSVVGRPAADVAAELGLTVNAALVAKSRVLRRLKQEASGLVD